MSTRDKDVRHAIALWSFQALAASALHAQDMENFHCCICKCCNTIAEDERGEVLDIAKIEYSSICSCQVSEKDRVQVFKANSVKGMFAGKSFLTSGSLQLWQERLHQTTTSRCCMDGKPMSIRVPYKHLFLSGSLLHQHGQSSLVCWWDSPESPSSSILYEGQDSRAERS